MKRVASVRRLLDARQMFQSNPDALLKTGIWYEQFWGKDQFMKWLYGCLDKKININGIDPRKSWRKCQDEYQQLLRRDARRINEYFQGLRSPGRNLLEIPELKARYPMVDNQPFEL